MDYILVFNKIAQDVFNNNNLLINENSVSDDIQEWDSLSNIRLIIKLEQYFQIRFEAYELSDLNNVGEFILLIKNKLSYGI